MEFSFENSVISEENSLFIPEINDGVRLSDSVKDRAKELLEFMEAAREYVLGFIPKDLDKNSSKKLQDYKTILQEIIQRNPEEKVEYVLRSQSGPDHDRHFVVEVCLNTNVIGHGEGHSKKQAEQQAAKEALRLMGCEV